jgi:hypothetical protein
MKNIYLPIFESVTHADVDLFLTWLAQQPNQRISMAKLQRTVVVRATTVKPLLKLLSQFSFIEQQPDAISLNATGMKYTKALPAARKVLLKNQFLTAWPMRDVLAGLDLAITGSLTREEVSRILKEGASMSVTDAMASGVMAWGGYCEFFRFDSLKGEISRVAVGPKAPSPEAPPVRQSA